MIGKSRNWHPGSCGKGLNPIVNEPGAAARARTEGARAQRGVMDQFSDLLLTSLTVGGSVFAAFLIVWFAAVSLKRRMSRQNPENMAVALSHPLEPRAELRREPRLAVLWHASVTSPSGEQQAQVKDISLGGAFVACAAPLPNSEEFEISIHPPVGAPLQLRAAVVWSNAGVPADKVVNRGMGVRFTGNDPGKRKQLADTLSLCLAPPSPPDVERPGQDPRG